MSNGHYLGFTPVDSSHNVPYNEYYNWPPFGWELNFPGIQYGVPHPWRGQNIVEWDSDGNEIWTWKVFNHYSFDDFSIFFSSSKKFVLWSFE